ncbi:MAG: hypothetical protein R3F55_09930 [Alphaproteobacteria bacterium]
MSTGPAFVLAAIAATTVHAEMPLVSRIETALDLSTPEATVATFAETFADDDYVAVYFALDPTARYVFMRSLSMLRMDLLLTPGLDGAAVRAIMDDLRGPYDSALEQDKPWVGPDVFVAFQSLMDSADRAGALAIELDGALTIDAVGPSQTIDGASEVVVETTVAYEGPVRFILREAPSGRWRVVSVIARPGAADEVTFLPRADR